MQVSTSEISEDMNDVITDAELDVAVDQLLLDACTDLSSLRQAAEIGRFDTESQRRAWFVISGLGRG